MKTPHLLASFAIAATASAADLKNPTALAWEWSESAIQIAPPLTSDLSLRTQADPAPAAPVGPVISINCWSVSPQPPAPRKNSLLHEPLIDAPRNPPPMKLLNDRPRGAMPWEYNGQVRSIGSFR